MTSIAVSPEGTLFASASWDSSIRIWQTGALTSMLSFHAAKLVPLVCKHAC